MLLLFLAFVCVVMRWKTNNEVQFLSVVELSLVSFVRPIGSSQRLEFRRMICAVEIRFIENLHIIETVLAAIEFSKWIQY